MKQQQYTTKTDVVSTEVDGEIVLLDLTTRRYYSLNETGSRIWELLDRDGQPHQIAQALVQEYELELSEAEEAVALLLEDLLAHGLIRLVSAAD